MIIFQRNNPSRTLSEDLTTKKLRETKNTSIVLTNIHSKSNKISIQTSQTVQDLIFLLKITQSHFHQESQNKISQRIGLRSSEEAGIPNKHQGVALDLKGRMEIKIKNEGI